MTSRLRHAMLVVCVAIAGWGGGAQAAYSGLTFFGDSLSDTGNVLSLTTALGTTPFPNFSASPGRFSNGPVWTEHVAAVLGFPTASNPSNLIFNGAAVVPIGPLGGQNFAFGGARTGLGGAAGATTGLFGQLIAWNGSAFSTSLTRAADPNALYVFLAGANDMRDFRSGASGALNPIQAATNVVNAMGLLAQAGAEHFLVANLPDLGLSPEAVGLGLVPQSTAATISFNAALAAGTAFLDAQFLGTTGVDLDIRSMDLFAGSHAINDDAINNSGALYGITNVTTPCIAPVAPGAYFFPGSTDINCSVSAFSDPLHPSARVHGLIADLAIAAAVPEPATLALFGIGLAGLGFARRKLN